MDEDSIHSEEQVRRDKLEKLEERGIDPYPSFGKRTIKVGDALGRFEQLVESDEDHFLVGRIMNRRRHGGLIFADLRDSSGEVQLILQEDSLSDDEFELFNELFDPADFVQVKGNFEYSKTDEESLVVEDFKMLAKSLKPLPEKWHGLKDTEKRYRKRYLDLLINEEVRDRFVKKHEIEQVIRDFLLERDYMEVDTPVLQPLPGGAIATPFKTYYEAVDDEVYLRIAPELYLKRLMVAGFERVFEFARVFRNEGISPQHLQDFTMLEFYEAYANYEDYMDMTEELFEEMAGVISDDLVVGIDGEEIDFTPPFERHSLRDLILDETGIDIDEYDSYEGLTEAMHDEGIDPDIEGKIGLGKLIDELYKKEVRPNITGPMFVTDHPKALSPLSKAHTDDPDKVQRFQLVVSGWELVNSFSEVNDPSEQKKRFKEQQAQREQGDDEAHTMDEEFIEALEHGMPPTAGFGMGIERVLAVLTDAPNVKEAVMFPFVKYKQEE